MGSIWFSKKAFLYFGGAAIIIIGGAIVLMAPYHYINFAVIENEQRPFEIWERDGYYPQLEISVSIRTYNITDVEIDLLFVENVTLNFVPVNITLDEENVVETPDATFLQTNIVIDVPYGNYTLTVERVEGAGLFDLGLKQISDSRLFIVIGGSMNIIGLGMGIAGYFVPGTFLPTDTDTIVEWGYDREDEENE